MLLYQDAQLSIAVGRKALPFIENIHPK